MSIAQSALMSWQVTSHVPRGQMLPCNDHPHLPPCLSTYSVCPCFNISAPVAAGPCSPHGMSEGQSTVYKAHFGSGFHICPCQYHCNTSAFCDSCVLHVIRWTKSTKSSISVSLQSSIGTCPHEGYTVRLLSIAVFSESNSATCA